MKSEFMVAITQLAAEKNLPKETVLATVEEAIAAAYKKDLFPTNENVSARIDQNTGTVRIFIKKTVVETPADACCEMTLADAQKITRNAQMGELLEMEATPPIAGRIAAQKAKQFILRRLHEAEHQSIYEEFSGKAGSIVNGVVQRVEPGAIFVDLGRVEAILPESEQIRNKHYRTGQRVKLYLMDPAKTARGSQIIVSHSHPGLLRKLMEVEIPEIYNGNVEIKAVAREAGFRSKVAVAAKQEGIDPVGSCVGLRGIRIQNIVNELNGEKIDVVQWVPNMAEFIANALSPAQVVGVELREAENAAIVSVPDKQLSLAIGKDGQNARLAAKLTGWRIDIKAAVPAEAKKPVEEKKPVVVKKAPEKPVEAPKAERAEGVKAPAVVPGKPAETEEKEVAAVGAAKAEETVPVAELEPAPAPEPVEEKAPEVSIEEVVASIASYERRTEPVLGSSGIRFAEDILVRSSTKSGKKKNKMASRDEARQAAAKARKASRGGAPATPEE
jgi:N utilization substance protein A